MVFLEPGPGVGCPEGESRSHTTETVAGWCVHRGVVRLREVQGREVVG